MLTHYINEDGNIRRYEKLLTDVLCLQDIPEPVKITFSYIDVEKFNQKLINNIGKLEKLKSNKANKVVDLLNNNGFKAVKSDYKKCSILDKDKNSCIIVTDTGITTPAYHPKKAREYAIELVNIFNESNIVLPFSKVSALTRKQLPYTKEEGFEFEENKSPFVTPPNSKIVKDIENRYGKPVEQFIDYMKEKALEQSRKLTNEELETEQIHFFTDNDELYSGKTWALDEYNIHPKFFMEGRARSYASNSFIHAFKYATNNIKERGFGFINVYNRHFKQKMVNDLAEETGDASDVKFYEKVETSLVPWKNDFLGTAMAFEYGRIFVIPNDKENDDYYMWQDFKQLYRVSYDKDYEMNLARTGYHEDAALNNGVTPSYYKNGTMYKEDRDRITKSLEKQILQENTIENLNQSMKDKKDKIVKEKGYSELDKFKNEIEPKKEISGPKYVFNPKFEENAEPIDYTQMKFRPNFDSDEEFDSVDDYIESQAQDENYNNEQAPTQQDTPQKPKPPQHPTNEHDGR